jgi:hypothetical protein
MSPGDPTPTTEPSPGPDRTGPHTTAWVSSRLLCRGVIGRGARRVLSGTLFPRPSYIWALIRASGRQPGMVQPASTRENPAWNS